jgi:hypothetical protein
VLGNVAAAPRSGPKTWVIVFDFIAGVAILAYGLDDHPDAGSR